MSSLWSAHVGPRAVGFWILARSDCVQSPLIGLFFAPAAECLHIPRYQICILSIYVTVWALEWPRYFSSAIIVKPISWLLELHIFRLTSFSVVGVIQICNLGLAHRSCANLALYKADDPHMASTDQRHSSLNRFWCYDDCIKIWT